MTAAEQVEAPVVVPEVVEAPAAPQYPKLSTVGFDARFPNQNQVRMMGRLTCLFS
jgi:hypothetical protein